MDQSTCALFDLLRPGECAVVSAPDAETTRRLFQTLAHVRVGGRVPALLSFGDELQANRHGGTRSLVVPRGASGRALRSAVPHFLSGMKSGTPLLFNGGDPGKGGHLLRQLLPKFRQKKLRVLVLVSRGECDPKEQAALKEAADFYFVIESAGLVPYGQFLSAKGVADPAFFLPRRVSITQAEFRLESPPRGSPSELLDAPYRRLFDAAPEAIVIFSIRKGDREANERARALLGKSGEELKGLGLADIVPRESLRPLMRALVELRSKGKAAADFAIKRGNGRRTMIHAAAGRLGADRFAVVLRDVTREELSQVTKDTYRSLVDGSPLPQATVLKRHFLVANEAFRKSFPWVHLNGEKSTSLAIFLGKRNAGLSRELLEFCERGSQPGDALRREVRLSGPAGGVGEYELSAVSVQRGPERLLHLTLVDVSARKGIIRSLEESEQRYRALIETGAGAVTLFREEKFAFVNSGYVRLLSYGSADELVGKSFDACVAAKDRRNFGEHLRKPAGRFEYRGVRKGGGLLWLEGFAEHIRIAEEEFTLVYHRDISAVRRYEEETAEKAKENEAVERVADALHSSLDYDSIVSEGLHSSLKALGFESGGFFRLEGSSSLVLAGQTGLPATIADALSRQSTLEGVTGLAAKTLEPLLLSVADYPAHLPYKSLFESAHVRAVAFVPLVGNGELNGMLFACTGRAIDPGSYPATLLAHLGRHFGWALANAKAYAAVREVEELYRGAVEGSSDVLYRALPDGTLVLMSSQVERLTGHTSEEFLKSPELWRSLLHPDDRPILSQRISRQMETVDQIELEYRLLPRRTAAYLWVRDSVRYLRDESGKVVSITGIVSDITARVSRERSLRDSEELSGNVLESVHEGVVVYDADFRCVSWNRAMESMTGIGREEMVGRSVIDPDREESGSLRQMLGRALLGETVNSDEVAAALPRGGKDRTLWGRYSPLRDRAGKTIGVVGTITDVTHRKVLERDVRESEETLRNVIDAMGDALMITDLQGKVWEVNREFSLLTGYPRSEVLGLMFPYPWLVDEEMGKFVTWIGALREKRYLRDFDMTWKAKDGRSFAISLNTTLLRNALGEPVAMLNLARNITERRQLSNELAVKNKQVEILNRIISKANASVEFSKIFDSMAIEVYNLLKYDQINVALLTEDGENAVLYACVSQSVDSPNVGAILPLEHTVAKLAIERGHAVIVGNLAQHKEVSPDVYSVTEGLKSQISIPITLNKRTLGTFNIASLREDAFTGRELAFLQPIADQIGATIDRTQLFQRVSDDGKYIHNLLDSLDSVVFTVDRNLRIREINKAWGEFARLQGTPALAEESAVVGLPLSDVINIPPLLDELSRIMPRLFEGSIETYSRECEVGSGPERKIFQLVISPMVIGGRVTALVFTNTDITETKRAEAEVRSRNKELVALNALSASISKSLNLEEVLNVAAEQTSEIIGAEVVLFHLLDASRDQLVLAKHRGVAEAAIGGVAVLDIHNSATGTAVMERRPLFISRGLSQDERVYPGAREVFRQLGLHSMAVFPLRSKDRVLGSLAAVFSREHEFITQEQRFLTLIGNQLGSAIENAQLYSEVQSQVERITSLYELGKGLAGALDTSRLFEAVYAEAVKSLPIDHFAYDAYAEAGGALTRIFQVDNGIVWHAKQGATRMEWPEGFLPLVHQAAKDRKPVWSSTPEGESVIVVPVESKSHIIGVLSVTKRGAQAYGEPHLRILESIANLTAIAVDRAMLFEDTIRKSTEIEQRNRELDDFTYVVSHDLKEPLITVEGYSKIVLHDYRVSLDDEGRGYLTSIVQATARMKGLIDDLLTLSRIGRVSELQQTVQVKGVIEDVLRDFEFTLREKHASVRVPPELPEVRYNPTQLSMVFRNLISNAVKFNTRSEPRVDIGVAEDEKEFTFSVQDNGIGIEPQHFERVFIVFQRLHRTEEYQGTGAGLTIVKKIVESHHGRIWVESEVGKGTTFRFTVPK